MIHVSLNNVHRFFATVSFCLVALLLSFPLLAEAHVLKQNDGINAVLHVPPYDNPMAGQPTQLQFTFAAVSGSFQINSYQVTVDIVQHGNTIQHVIVTPAFTGADTEGNTTVKFPVAGVYTAVLHGIPKSSEVPKFDMAYLLRVTGSAASVKAGVSSSEVLLISGATIIILGMVIARQIITNRQLNTTEASESVEEPKRPRRKP